MTLRARAALHVDARLLATTIAAVSLGCASLTGGAAPASRARWAANEAADAPLARGFATGGTMAELADGRVAIVDEDDGHVAIASLNEGASPTITPVELGVSVSAVVGASTGFVATAPEADEIVFVDAALRVRSRAAVPCRPTTLARTGSREVWIACTDPPSVVAVAVAVDGTGPSLTVGPALAVAPDPRAIAVDDRGQVWVAHARGGAVTRIAPGGRAVTALTIDRPVLDEATPRRSTWGIAPVAWEGRILVPHVLAAPGDPQVQTRGYGGAPRTVLADVATIDQASAALETRSPVDPLDPEELAAIASRPGRVDDCLLPIASAIHPGARALLVACRGTDDVVALAADAPAPARAELGRARFGAGLASVLVLRDGTVALHESFDRALRRLALTVDSNLGGFTFRDLGVVRLPGLGLAPALARGRATFHRIGDARVAADGRACASCHPSGADDGLVWSTPDGPRRTLSLARVPKSGDGPLSWSGTETDLVRRIFRTTERLGASSALSFGEATDLALYVGELGERARAARAKPPGRSASPRAARGRHQFQEMGCASCHSGSRLSDGSRHDVGSRVSSDRGAAFATPPLYGIRRSPPYYHDGRYPTLRALVFATSDPMGDRFGAAPDALEDLLAYLESLD